MLRIVFPSVSGIAVAERLSVFMVSPSLNCCSSSKNWAVTTVVSVVPDCSVRMARLTVRSVSLPAPEKSGRRSSVVWKLSSRPIVIVVVFVTVELTRKVVSPWTTRIVSSTTSPGRLSMRLSGTNCVPSGVSGSDEHPIQAASTVLTKAKTTSFLIYRLWGRWILPVCALRPLLRRP